MENLPGLGFRVLGLGYRVYWRRDGQRNGSGPGCMGFRA